MGIVVGIFAIKVLIAVMTKFLLQILADRPLFVKLTSDRSFLSSYSTRSQLIIRAKRRS
jgi:hypothetical protein